MAEPTLAEHIANELRRDILRGKLAPGESIKERDNAAEMGVSRTPMREAIRILAKEGLIQLRPSRSPIVARPNFKNVEDHAQVLIALEKLSAELAVKNASDEDISHIAGIVDHMSEHFDTSDPLDMFEIDMSFHTAIADASKNKALAETHRTFLQRLWRARYLAASQRRNRQRVVNEHTLILNALRGRDAKAARAAIDNHLWHLAEDIREVIEKESAANNSAGTPTGDPQ
ncbi:GntR family transcriptional regulator [Actibacterium pelagium]|nr:GntR family transcriptional regulator [Actibacterium pelagium]